MMRLLIGPANYAGQAHAWAGAARTHLGVESLSFSHGTRPFRVGPGPAFTFQTDIRLPHPKTLTTLGRRWRRRRLSNASHVILDGFIPVGEPLGSGMDGDLRYFLDRGLDVGMLSHGSDIRHPDEHIALVAHSYFKEAPAPWVDTMRRLVERNQMTLQQFPDVPLFVSTPDLLLHQPRATWLPLCVDPSLFRRNVPPALEGERPVVLHIPSRRNPPIKGTQFIEPVLMRLQAEGVVDYVSPEAVSHREMIDLMAQSDVVIDQILTGSYGLTAVEAMALGRVVLGNVSAAVADRMLQAPPIVDTTPEDLEETLRAIAHDPHAYASRGPQGRQFVTRWHDGRAASSALEPFLST